MSFNEKMRCKFINQQVVGDARNLARSSTIDDCKKCDTVASRKQMLIIQDFTNTCAMHHHKQYHEPHSGSAATRTKPASRMRRAVTMPSSRTLASFHTIVKVFILSYLAVMFVGYFKTNENGDINFDGKRAERFLFVQAGSKSSKGSSKTTVIAIDGGGGGGKPHPVPVPWPVVHCHHHHHHMKYVPKPVLVHHWVKKAKPSFEMDATSVDQHVVNLPINLQGSTASDPALPALMNEEFQPTIVRPDTILPQQELVAGGKLVASLNSVFDDHANSVPPSQYRPSSSFMKPLAPVNRIQVEKELKRLQWQQQQELKRKYNNGPKFNQTKLINKLTHSILESNSKIPFGIDGDSSQKSIVLASNNTGLSAELLSGNKPVVATSEDNWINLSEQKQPAYELSSSPSSLDMNNQQLDSLSSMGSQTKHLLDSNLNHDALMRDESQQHHDAASVDFLTELGKANAREESEAARMFAQMSLEQANRMQSVLNTNPRARQLAGSPGAVYMSPHMQPSMMQNYPVLANTGVLQRYVPNSNLAASVPLTGSATSESRAILTMTKLAESIAQAEANKLLKKQIKHQHQASVNDTSTAKLKSRDSNPLRMLKLFSLFNSPGISNNKDKRRAAAASFIDTLNYAAGDAGYPNRRFVHTWPGRDRAQLLYGDSLARKSSPATMNHIVAIPSLPKQLIRVTQRDDRPLSQIVNGGSSRIYRGTGRYSANDMLAQSSNMATKVTVRVDREVSDTKKDQDTKKRSKSALAKTNTANGTALDVSRPSKVVPDSSSTKSPDIPVVTPTTMNPEQEISFYNGQQDHLKKLKSPADQLNTAQTFKGPENPIKLYNIESSNVHNSIVEPSLQQMSPLSAPTGDESGKYNTISGEPMQSWLEHQLLYTKQMQPLEQYNKLPEDQSSMQPNQFYQQQPVADQLTVPASSSYLEFPLTPQQWSAEALKSINDLNYQDNSISEEQSDVQANSFPTNSAGKETIQSDSKDSPSLEPYNSNGDNRNQLYQAEHNSPAVLDYGSATLPLSSSNKFKSENMSEWEKYLSTKFSSQNPSSQNQGTPMASWQNDQQIMMYSQQNPHFSQLNQPGGYQQASPASSSYELRPPNYANLVQLDPYYHGQYSSPLASYGTVQFANPFMPSGYMAPQSSPSLVMPNSATKWGHGGNMINLTAAGSSNPLMSPQYGGPTKAGKLGGSTGGLMPGINQLPTSGSLNVGIQQPAFSGVETLDTATNEMSGLRQFHDSISQGVNQADNVTTMARLSQQLRDQMKTLQARLPSMPNIPQPPQIPNLPMPPPGMMQMAGLALPFAMARANRIRNQQVNGAAAGGGSTAGQRLFQSAATITNRIVRPRRRPTRSPSSRPGGSVSTPPARGSTGRGLFGVLRNLADLNRRPPNGPLSASGTNGASNGHRQSSSILSGGPKIKPKVDRVSYGKSMDRGRFVSKWHQWINEAGSPGQIPLTLNDGSMRSFSSMTSPMDMLANQLNSRLAPQQHNERFGGHKERVEPQLANDEEAIKKTLGYNHLLAVEPTKTTDTKYELIMPQDLAYGQAKSSANLQHGPLVPLPLVSNYINLLMFAAQNVTQGGDLPVKPTTTTSSSNQVETEIATTQPAIEVSALSSERPLEQTNELLPELSGGQQPSLQVLSESEQPMSDSQRIQHSAETTTPTSIPVGEVRHTRSTSEAPNRNNRGQDEQMEDDQERLATASSADYVRAIKLVRGVAYPWPPPTKSSKMLDKWQPD